MTSLHPSPGYLLRSTPTKQTGQHHSRLEILVFEGTTQLFDRVHHCMRMHDVTVTRVDQLPDSFKASANEPVIAIASLTNDEQSCERLQRLIASVLWVDLELKPGIPAEYILGPQVLAYNFTDADLLAMVESVSTLRPGFSQQVVNGTVVVARSDRMTNLLDEVAAFATSDHNVLIQGETGVGKELIARLVHQSHRRYSAGPFVAVNCGAVPEGLFESLFFGHTKGSFTGAIGAHKGYLEQANGGTLFLDEIGDLPVFQQVKLLRVLESSIVTRVGSELPVQLDFRLVAATNRNLRALVRAGTFRADLFYRLAVIEFAVPNLEERGAADKIVMFSSMLLQIIETPAGVKVSGSGSGSGSKSGTGGGIEIPPWVIEQIADMNFPGNVRQLRNLAERIGVIYKQTGQWTPKLILNALGLAREMGVQSGAKPARIPTGAQREHIIFTLDQNGWQRQKTAIQLGISRKSLWERMRKFGIDGAATEKAPPDDD